MIRFENVKKVYEGTGKNPGIVALNNVNLDIGKGEMCIRDRCSWW